MALKEGTQHARSVTTNHDGRLTPGDGNLRRRKRTALLHALGPALVAAAMIGNLLSSDGGPTWISAVILGLALLAMGGLVVLRWPRASQPSSRPKRPT